VATKATRRAGPLIPRNIRHQADDIAPRT